MDKRFPKEMKMFGTAPNVKKAFVSDVAPILGDDCENCGGVGVFALFCALHGPFQTPAPSNQKEGDMYIVSHWDSGVIPKGGWWAGVTYTFPCPVCIGTGKKGRQYNG